MQHFPRRDDRSSLLLLLAALDASTVALKRDGCGDWAVIGRLGHVYVDGSNRYVAWIKAAPMAEEEQGEGEGKFMVTKPCGARRWSGIKERLMSYTVQLDGDDEGIIVIDRMPSAQEAAIWRDALGLRKRRRVSEETMATLVNRLSKVAYNRPSGDPTSI